MDARSLWIAFAVFVGVLFVSMYAATYAPSYQYCRSNHSEESAQSNSPFTNDLIPKSGGTVIDCESFFANANGGAITAIATVLLAVVTAGLVWLGIIQLLTTRTQLRAQVFPKNFAQFWVIDTPVKGYYGWRFRPMWENSGSTPAERAQIFMACDVRNSALPAGFDFDQVLRSQTPIVGLLAPGAILGGGLAPTLQQTPVSPQDIWDSQNAGKFIYLYGKVQYADIFPRTKQHVTRFCWLIVADGNPFSFIPNDPMHALTFSYVMHAEGNYTENI